MPRSRSAVVRPAPSSPPLDRILADEARFFRTWFESPKTLGAVSPSGRFLARAMARCVDPDGTGPVVELGPGTGPVTQALLDHGVAPKRLVLVEFEPAFCTLLAKRFPQCRVVQGDAYRLRRALDGIVRDRPAAIVSSLPLLTKPEPERAALLTEAFDLMGPQGQFIQFTYGRTSPVPLVDQKGRKAFEVAASPPIWLNIPPARVFVYRPRGAKRPADLFAHTTPLWWGKAAGALDERGSRAEAALRRHWARLREDFGFEPMPRVRERCVPSTRKSVTPGKARFRP